MQVVSGLLSNDAATQHATIARFFHPDAVYTSHILKVGGTFHACCWCAAAVLSLLLLWRWSRPSSSYVVMVRLTAPLHVGHNHS